MIELNKIYNDDCLNVLKQIDDGSIDLVVTDCPYKIISGGMRIVETEDETGGILNKRDYTKTDPSGCLRRGTKRKSCSSQWIKQGELNIPDEVKNGKMFEYNDIEFHEWLPEIYRVLKEGTHCYIMINGRNLKDLQICAEEAGFIYQNLLVWDKGNATPNKYYLNATEFILMLSKRPAKNINEMGWSNILKIPNIIGNKKHPTEKPVSLMEILIRNSSNVGDIVLDPFCGAGSTVLATKNLNRRFIGIEVDEKYYKVAESRLINESYHPSLFSDN